MRKWERNHKQVANWCFLTFFFVFFRKEIKNLVNCGDLPILRLLGLLDIYTRLQKRMFVETKSTEIILTGSCLFVCLAVAEEGGWRNIPENGNKLNENQKFGFIFYVAETHYFGNIIFLLLLVFFSFFWTSINKDNFCCCFLLSSIHLAIRPIKRPVVN